MTNLRSKLNKYSPAISAALLLFLAAIAWHLWPKPAAPPVATSWYFELDTGKLFVHADVMPASVQSPAGGRSARAFVFACGDCSDPAKQFVGWLETEAMAEGTSESTWRLARASPMGDQGEGSPVRLLMRLPSEKDWSSRNGKLLSEYQSKVADSCKGLAPLTPCPAVVSKR